MSELTLALIMAAISIGISAVGAALITWLHLRDDERAFLPPSRLRRRRITASVGSHFLWWGIVFPFAFIGILFPTVEVANIIWKFLP